MTSDVRYEIKLRYLLSDLKILTEKSGSVRLNEHEHKLILVLVDPVDDEDWKRSSTN